MESDKTVETIEKVARKLTEDEEFNAKNKDNEGRHHQQRHLLSRLHSEIESMEEDKNVSEESKEKEAAVENPLSLETDEKTKTAKEEVGICSSSSNEEIIKELKKIKRQNSITHCLLTTLIVVTLAWQYSEVSLILKIKNGFSNPLKSVGGIVKGIWNSRNGVIKQASDLQKQVTEQTSLKIPHLELPGVDRDNDDRRPLEQGI